MDGVQISQSLTHQSLDKQKINAWRKRFKTHTCTLCTETCPNSDWRWSGVAELSSVLKNQLILEWPEPLSRLFSYSDSRNDGRLDGVDAILGGERSPPKHFASKEKRLLTPSQSKTLIGKRLLQLLKRKQFCPSEVDFFWTTWQLFSNKKFVSRRPHKIF